MTAIGDVLLPEGTRLLHIGPHKTGTSSVQSAFHLTRGDAARYGVRYAGPNRQPLAAAQAAAARGSKRESTRPIGPWRALLREVRGSDAARIVISSEWFSDAGEDAIRGIVDDLDPARVHVVITVRPLASVLPSQWQQFVIAGRTEPYDVFLQSVFGEPTAASRTFWHRHRHDELVNRWAAAVGARNVTVVVVDDRDHGMVLRAFEALVGLPTGLLVAEDERSNRSLTRSEIELIRELNSGLAREMPGSRLGADLVLVGAAANLRARRPEPAELRIVTPTWARRRAAPVGKQIAQGIDGSGVRVMGRLQSLATRPQPPQTHGAGAPDSSGGPWPEIAATAAMGVILAGGLARGRRSRLAAATAWEDGVTVSSTDRPPRLDALSTHRLRSIFLARARDALGARLPRRPRRRATDPGAPPIHSARSEVE